MQARALGEQVKQWRPNLVFETIHNHGKGGKKGKECKQACSRIRRQRCRAGGHTRRSLQASLGFRALVRVKQGAARATRGGEHGISVKNTRKHRKSGLNRKTTTAKRTRIGPRCAQEGDTQRGIVAVMAIRSVGPLLAAAQTAVTHRLSPSCRPPLTL